MLYPTFSKKKKKNKCFAPEKMKKTPFKIAHNMPTMLFFSTGLAAHTAQKQKIQTAIMESVFIQILVYFFNWKMIFSAIY